MNIPKYRTWHKQLKKMMPVLEINLDPEFGGVFVWGKAYYDADTGEHEADKDFWPWSDIELMQWTGRKDKNGVEIYEDDTICTNNQRQDDYVREHYVGIVFYCTERAMYRIKLSDDTYIPALTNTAIADIEVIGNIWQHPHLLQSKEPQP